jgi:hypothetical protein
MRRGGRAGHVAGTAAEHLFKILPYKQARKLTRGFNHRIEAHKLLEWRHVRTRMCKDDIPAVILSFEEHQRISQALYAALPTGQEHAMDFIWRAYQDVYTRFGYAQWLSHIEKYFR